MPFVQSFLLTLEINWNVTSPVDWIEISLHILLGENSCQFLQEVLTVCDETSQSTFTKCKKNDLILKKNQITSYACTFNEDIV